MKNFVKSSVKLVLSLVLVVCFVPISISCAPQKSKVSLSFGKQDKFTLDSTPLIIKFTSTSDSTDDEKEIYHAVKADEDSVEIELDKGSWEASAITPLNPDGQFFNVDLDEEDTGGGFSCAATLDPVAEDQITSENIQKIKDEIAEAIEKGDESLSGEGVADEINSKTEVATNAVAEKEKAAAEAAKKAEEDAKKTFGADTQTYVWQGTTTSAGSTFYTLAFDYPSSWHVNASSENYLEVVGSGQKVIFCRGDYQTFHPDCAYNWPAAYEGDAPIFLADAIISAGAKVSSCDLGAHAKNDTAYTGPTYRIVMLGCSSDAIGSNSEYGVRFDCVMVPNGYTPIDYTGAVLEQEEVQQGIKIMASLHRA